MESHHHEPAVICHRQVHSDAGGATIHYVRVADGFLLDCGTDLNRAIILARTINRGRPELFSTEGLRTA